ncbi:LD-carboxypeptidase [Macrococcus brunensis]|uniref:LD-carboxypeptidase n=1 Tax=Macrococcus brunensis TaxID=198483 RepID=A0A4R6BED0_9STAP|nr:S66 peptidase family protein [Macrococcus brunensis]TDL98098.1 LD-carboxypeptidase [Macrococcus brunensis]
MIKPVKLKKGDTVALVSLSSGLAGEENLRWRTEQGIERLEKVFGLHVKVMPHALKGIEYLYQHPEKRAQDLHQALQDKEVKGIICAIGGYESIRLLPYIDFDILRKNPKVFSGYSDTTVQHLMFYQAGISSSYGPALLTDFAENVEMDDYTVDNIKKTWFSSEVIGEIKPAAQMRQYGLKWEPENQFIARDRMLNSGYEILNGSGKVQGHLIGGCLESLAKLRGVSIFPTVDQFKGAIFFVETSEVYIKPHELEEELRSFAAMGIFDAVNGVIVGKPQNNVYYDEYKLSWQKIMQEYGHENLPILYNASFGHNEPKCILPYGLQAEIDTETLTFKVLESAIR